MGHLRSKTQDLCRYGRWVARLAALAVIPAIIPSVPVGALEPIDTSPSWVLERLWRRTSPGAITAPPRDVLLDVNAFSWGSAGREEEAFLILASEDRRIRLIDRSGEERGVVRTGVRTPIAVSVAPGAIVETVTPDGVLRLVLYPGDRGGRTTPVAVSAQAVGHTLREARRDAGFDPDSVVAVPDSRGNWFAVTPPQRISHVSARGALLWERPVPSPITSVAAVADGILAATRDGRVFAFDGSGTGSTVLSHSAPVHAVAGVPVRSGTAVVLADAEGAVSWYLRREGAERFVLQWGFDIGERSTLVGRDDGPSQAVADNRMRWSTAGLPIVLRTASGALIALNRSGREAWRLSVPGSPVTHAVMTGREPLRVVAVDSDNRLLLIDESGVIRNAVELDARPVALSWLPRADYAVLVYGDWSVEAFSIADTSFPEADDLPLARVAPSGVSRLNALSALADAALSDTTYTARETLLATIAERLAAARLFGSVDAVYEILAELASESYRTPVRRSSAITNDFPGVRAGALALLRDLGDREAVRVAHEAVRWDPDARVVATAIGVIAARGIDEQMTRSVLLRRFAAASASERTILASAIVDFLAAVPPRSAGEAAIHRDLALAVSQAAIPRELREAALRALR